MREREREREREGDGGSGAGPSLAFAFALAFALVAGCTSPSPPSPTTVPPPRDGGGFGTCHTSAAQTLAVDFRADATKDARGHSAGLHRLTATTFLYVWAAYEDTLRQDSVARVDAVEVYREPDPAAPLEVCTRVDLATPTQVDGERRTYDVAVLYNATSGLPGGPVRFLVDWAAGCSCDALPEGNATALFEP